MSSLKVNARTKILEFKKKHNRVVDELPTEVEKETLERFEKVYINDLPQDVKDFLESHFDSYNSKITFSINELNNYKWTNLANYLNNYDSSDWNTDKQSLSVDYNDESFTLDEAVQNSDLYWYNSDNNIAFWLLESEQDKFGKWELTDNDEELLLFEHSLNFYCQDLNFGDVKQAIIKDLLENLGYEVILTEEEINEKISEAISGIQSGTKLYKHVIGITKSGQANIGLVLITTSSGEISLNSYNDSRFGLKIDRDNIISADVTTNIDNSRCLLKKVSVYSSSTNFTAVKVNITTGEVAGQITFITTDYVGGTITDTVTEL